MTKLTHIIIPETVTNIGDFAFAHNNLTNLILPSTLTRLGDGALKNNHLQTLSLTNLLSDVGKSVAMRNMIQTATLDGSNNIPSQSFYKNSLTDFTISDNVVHIGSEAFRYNYLQNLVIPSSVTFIGENAFANNDLLSSISFNEGLVSISDGAFSHGKIKEIVLPQSLRSIGNNAFQYQPITSFVFGSGVEIEDADSLGIYGQGILDLYLLNNKIRGNYTYRNDTYEWSELPPEFVWAKTAGGVNYDSGFGIATDSEGNSYVVGRFEGTASFGAINLTSSSILFWDIFITKIDAGGNFIWATKAGGANYDSGFDIAVDADDNIYITGIFSGTSNFGTISLSSGSVPSVFIAKLNSEGNFLWAVKAGGNNSITDYCYGKRLATDAQGNVYLTGRFAGTIMFGTIPLTWDGEADIYIAKADPDGNFIWATKAGGIAFDDPYSIATDSAGNSYITGLFGETAYFGSFELISDGESEVFVAKINMDGQFEWATKAGGIANDKGCGIVVNNSGEVYITGNFEDTAYFGQIELTTDATNNIFVAKLDSNGVWLWASGANDGDNNLSVDVAIDMLDNLLCNRCIYWNHNTRGHQFTVQCHERYIYCKN